MIFLSGQDNQALSGTLVGLILKALTIDQRYSHTIYEFFFVPPIYIMMMVVLRKNFHCCACTKKQWSRM